MSGAGEHKIDGAMAMLAVVEMLLERVPEGAGRVAASRAWTPACSFPAPSSGSGTRWCAQRSTRPRRRPSAARG